ncbi:HutD family protein [Bdellovibrionota bacterium FG-2]
MPIIHLTSRDFKQMPWKNGKGTTTQIAIYPPEAEFPGDAFLWRVSSAPIDESGAFSTFPGYDRLLMITEGSGIILNGKPLVCGQPLGFSGEEASQGELIQGPVRDLGIIYRRGEVRAQIALSAIPKGGPSTLTLPLNSEFHLFVCVQGEFKVHNAPTERLATGECLFVRDSLNQKTLQLTAMTANAAIASVVIDRTT